MDRGGLKLARPIFSESVRCSRGKKGFPTSQWGKMKYEAPESAGEKDGFGCGDERGPIVAIFNLKQRLISTGISTITVIIRVSAADPIRALALRSKPPTRLPCLAAFNFLV